MAVRVFFVNGEHVDIKAGMDEVRKAMLDVHNRDRAIGGAPLVDGGSVAWHVSAITHFLEFPEAKVRSGEAHAG